MGAGANIARAKRNLAADACRTRHIFIFPYQAAVQPLIETVDIVSMRGAVAETTDGEGWFAEHLQFGVGIGLLG